jgi:hypothetical protein
MSCSGCSRCCSRWRFGEHESQVLINMIGRDFGCERCWPSSADAAWEEMRTLTSEADLIDESHFHVVIRACRVCAQRFVSVFTETIDWASGDDPQYWTLLPITGPEAAELVRRGESLTESELNGLQSDRRCLRHDHPKGEGARSFWAKGISVREHD